MTETTFHELRVSLVFTFCIFCLLTQAVQGTDSTPREMSFERVSSPSMGVYRMEQGWTARSKISCIETCMRRFPGLCVSIMYNSDTRLCTSGGSPDMAEPLPSHTEGDLYFDRNSFHMFDLAVATTEATLICNTNDGFYLYTHGTESACIKYIHSTRRFSDAVVYCDNLDSKLLMTKTWDKFLLFRALVSSEGSSVIWHGLTDELSEGTWYWQADGSAPDHTLLAQMFRVGEPNGDLSENCARLEMSQQALNDITCLFYEEFVCERPLE